MCIRDRRSGQLADVAWTCANRGASLQERRSVVNATCFTAKRATMTSTPPPASSAISLPLLGNNRHSSRDAIARNAGKRVLTEQRNSRVSPSHNNCRVFCILRSPAATLAIPTSATAVLAVTTNYIKIALNARRQHSFADFLFSYDDLGPLSLLCSSCICFCWCIRVII